MAVHRLSCAVVVAFIIHAAGMRLQHAGHKPAVGLVETSLVDIVAVVIVAIVVIVVIVFVATIILGLFAANVCPKHTSKELAVVHLSGVVVLNSIAVQLVPGLWAGFDRVGPDVVGKASASRVQ